MGPAATPALRIDVPVPHPIRTSATIGYQVDENEPVTIRVYDVKGRRVATLVEQTARAAGSGMVEFNASALASGVYFVRLETPTGTVARKITVLK